MVQKGDNVTTVQSMSELLRDQMRDQMRDANVGHKYLTLHLRLCFSFI